MTDAELQAIKARFLLGGRIRQADVPILLGEVDKLRAALTAVEWVFEEYAASCPWCGQIESERHGHALDCQRQIALGKVTDNTHV
jgi:hypothetical protein